MDDNDPTIHSHLFLMRLWPGGRPDGGTGWQGRIQHLASSEAGQFQDWSSLVVLLESLLAELEPDRAPPPRSAEGPPAAPADAEPAL